MLSLVLMIVWALVSPSWLSFVLLAWSCIFWVAPVPPFLRSTKFAVLYAIALIALRYVYYFPASTIPVGRERAAFFFLFCLHSPPLLKPRTRRSWTGILCRCRHSVSALRPTVQCASFLP